MSFMEMLINKLDSLFIKATSKNLSPEEVERKIELRSQKREELWARKKQEYETNIPTNDINDDVYKENLL